METMMIDQESWLVQIKESLQIHGEKEEEREISVSIYGVPKELLAVKPEAYVPQCVSIGPYHHWRSKLYGMERCKLSAGRRYQKRLPSDSNFESVVEEVKKYECQIRNCYHKYLDYKDEALAWLMALDASFVLHCLQFHDKQADQAASSHGSSGKVLELSRRSEVHNAIMRDLMMLENQIPLFLLQNLLEMQLGSQGKAEDRLCNMVSLACKEISPFMLNSSRLSIKDRGHILEVLYYSIVPVVASEETISKENEDDQISLPDSTRITRALKAIWEAVSSLPVQLAPAFSQRLLQARPVKLVTQLSKSLFSSIQNISVKSEGEKDEIKDEEKDGEGGSSSVETPPTRDELDVPSVSDLYSAGVKFLPTEGDLTTIRFDPATATLYLPKLRLDSNTEVVLRNLVAFEASAAPGALIFTRYTDFMNGIIDTDEDVRLLRKSGIIYNHLADDGKVASLWNGMGKCVKLTKVRYLDQVIADVNKHYNKRWSVAVKEYIKRNVFGSWQLLTVLVSGILLVLTCLEAFCSVYDCKRWWSATSFSQD